MDINVEKARYYMVEQQIRTWNVLNQQILDLISASPREDYVSEPHRNLAYIDMSLPLGSDRYTLTPKLEARILQELTISESDRILELGAANGYLTSLLAKLGDHVYSLEPNAALLTLAENNLRSHQINNITIKNGDLNNGWQEYKPFDVIVINGSIPQIPDALCQALNINGRLFAVTGSPPAMEAILVKRLGKNHFSRTTLFETDLPAFPQETEASQFVF
jgi:protein-L-isoaspartate(D-aspartate) O-methyltransferase